MWVDKEMLLGEATVKKARQVIQSITGFVDEEQEEPSEQQKPEHGDQQQRRQEPWAMKGMKGVVACLKVEQISGDKDCVVEAGGCKLTFPEGSIEGSCEVKLFAMFNEDLVPEGYTSVTSFIDVELSKPLLVPVKVEIESLCAIYKTPVEADILRFKANSWGVMSTIPLPDMARLSFNCMEFSPLFVAIKELLIENVRYPLKTSVTLNEDNTFHVSSYINHSLIQSMASEYERDVNMVMDFNIFEGIINDEILIQFGPEPISGNFPDYPKILLMRPTNEYPVSIDRKFLDGKYRNTYGELVAADRSQESIHVPLGYSVIRNDKKVDGPHCFNVIWRRLEHSLPSSGASTSQADGQEAK